MGAGNILLVDLGGVYTGVFTLKILFMICVLFCTYPISISLLKKLKLRVVCTHLYVDWEGPVEGRERRNLMGYCPEEVSGMRLGHRWEVHFL